jgi:hypothetical protein
MEVNVLLYTPAALPPRERDFSTHYIGESKVPQSLSGRGGGEEKFRPQLGTLPQSTTSYHFNFMIGIFIIFIKAFHFSI